MKQCGCRFTFCFHSQTQIILGKKQAQLTHLYNQYICLCVENKGDIILEKKKSRRIVKNDNLTKEKKHSNELIRFCFFKYFRLVNCFVVFRLIHTFVQQQGEKIIVSNNQKTKQNKTKFKPQNSYINDWQSLLIIIKQLL